MASPEHPEQRRSPRYPFRLLVELHSRLGTRQLPALDVSRHGLFVATASPPHEKTVLRVTLHAPTGPIKATAFVSRSHKPPEVEKRGMGLELFSLLHADKQRWDAMFCALEQKKAPTLLPDEHGAASFVLKLKDRAQLDDFYRKSVNFGGTLLVTPITHPVGTVVALHMVHPYTSDEFVLWGVVVRIHHTAPKGLEIRHHAIDDRVREDFRAFVKTGAPGRGPTPDKQAVADLSIDIDVVDNEGFDWAITDDDLLINLDLDEAVLDAEGLPGVLFDPEAPHVDEQAWDELQDVLGRLPACRERVVRCTACESEADAELGPAPGVLGLVARSVPRWCAHCATIRAGYEPLDPEARSARLEALSGAIDALLQAPVPLRALLEVAALSDPARCGFCAHPLERPAVMTSLEESFAREDEDPVQLVGPCPRCGEGVWEARWPRRLLDV